MYKYLTRCSKHKYNGISHKRNIDIFNNIKNFEILTEKHHKQLKSKQFWRNNCFFHKYDKQRQQVFYLQHTKFTQINKNQIEKWEKGRNR